MAEPVKFAVTLTDNSGQWFNHQVTKMDSALLKMGQVVKNESQIKVPKENNYLVNSVQVVPKSKQVAIIYTKPYAGYQERGKRADGSHVVKKYSTPNTGAHYLEQTGKSVVERGIKWFLSHS